VEPYLQPRVFPTAVAMDSTGAVLLSGVFVWNITLGASSILYSAGHEDGFVVKYGP
jgi:hypothetical protein